MKQPLVQYTDAFMFAPAVAGGITTKELELLTQAVAMAKRQLIQDWKGGAQGWLGCPDDMQLVKEVEAMAKKYRAMDTCLVLGIGGSDLGTRAAFQALRLGAKGMQLEFLGANTDPDEISEVLARLNPKKTIVNIISKSGETIEPMATFFYVREYFAKHIGMKKFSQQVIATTDSHYCSLCELAVNEKYQTLHIPKNIGGRFSVLTAVGLFPLACAGISIRQLLEGAAAIREDFIKQPPYKNAAVRFATLQCIAEAKGKNLQVLMPYSARLEHFGRWYRQLWAESLGKKLDRQKKIVNSGPTPIAALGATDQHSQIQLYVEGPNDKTVTFIRIEKPAGELHVPADISRVQGLSYAARRPFSHILHAEQEATAWALKEAGRQSGTISIGRLTPQSLGALFMFFEVAVGISGELYNINTYDQPGVEAGKRAMRSILGIKRQARKAVL